MATAGRGVRVAKAARGRPASVVPVEVAVRPVRREDLERVIALDAAVTGIAKRNYWRSVYERYGKGAGAERLAAKKAKAGLA